MIPTVIIVAVELITLHMIDGRVVQINPDQVTRLIAAHPGGAPNKALPDAVQCVVRFTDGTFVSVAENCEAVRELMDKQK
jgi:hypothetical protein